MNESKMQRISQKTRVTPEDLTLLAKRIRRLTIDMAIKSGTGHIASGLSMCEILAVLLFKVLKWDFVTQLDKDRDFFLLSKGHGAISLYAAMHIKGLLTKEEILSYMENGSRLTAFPAPPYLTGIDFSSGSLGHGLSVAAGIALGKKRDNSRSRVFVILSEGDCQEGSTWEAALFAGFHKLNNLIVIIDHNKLQAFGSVKEVLDLYPFAEKWRSFNFSVIEVDGHDIKELYKALDTHRSKGQKPTVVIAHTVKGKGVSFMENIVAWHYLPIKGKHIDIAIKEIEEE